MPKKPTLSPWFPASVKPARVGVYEILGASYNPPNFRRWNGRGWGGTYGFPSRSCQTDQSTVYEHGKDMTHWRGLAEQPK